MSSPRFSRVAPFALLFGLSPAHAAADAASVKAEPELESAGADSNEDGAAKLRARTLYERGARAYADGKYYDAADLFLEAHRAYPAPALLFNIAKAWDRAGQASAALSYYRAYLRQSRQTADDETALRVRDLEARLAERGVQQFSVISDPEAALVRIDDHAVGVTPWTGETWPGKHRVSIEASGYERFESVVELEPLRASDLTVKLSRAAAPAAKAAQAPQPPTEPPAVQPLTWAVLGTGTAALGAALIVEMLSKENDGLSRTGAFFAGAGAASSVLGGVLLYVDLGSGEPHRSGKTAEPRRAWLGYRAHF